MNKSFHSNKIILTLLSVIVFCLLISTLALYFHNRSQSMSAQEKKQAIVRLLDEVWSKGNFQMVDQLIAPQYTIRHDPGDPWEGKTLDLTTFKERVKLSHHVFPNQKFYIEDLVCDGNKVSVSWKFTGTQKGAIPGLPVTDKTVNVSGLTIYYFKNGKIIGHWQIVDRLGFLEQLGIQKGKSKN